MQVYIIIALAFAILAVGFTVQNNATVTIHILTHTYQTSIAWVAIVSVFLGALLMGIVDILIRLTRRGKKKEVAQANKNKEEETKETFSAYERKLEVIQGEIVNLKSEIQRINMKLSEIEEKTRENVTEEKERPSSEYSVEDHTEISPTTTEDFQQPIREVEEET